MLQDAQRYGWHWVGQFVDPEGEWREAPASGYRKAVWERWCLVLQDSEGGLAPCWDPRKVGEEGNRCSDVLVQERMREYNIHARAPKLPHDKMFVGVSDGSMRDGRASCRMVPVQGGGFEGGGRIAGAQGIAKAELIGGWMQVHSVVAELERHEDTVFHGFLEVKKRSVRLSVYLSGR